MRATDQTYFEYNHPVKVSAESGELLGTGHFVGEAGINHRTGVSKWSGNLDTDIDPLLLVQGGELRLEFENGVGYARCPSANITAHSGSDALFLVMLRGQGEPPRVDAD